MVEAFGLTNSLCACKNSRSMFHVQKITSFGAPELQPYATLRRPLEHREQGIFVAESERVVRRLLKSRFTIVSLCMPEKHLEDFRADIEARPEPITVYLAPRQ